MFKEKLYNILGNINKMKSHDDAMVRCVSQKLDNSLNNYMKEVSKTCNYLLSRSNYKVVKGIARQEAKKER